MSRIHYRSPLWNSVLIVGLIGLFSLFYWNNWWGATDYLYANKVLVFEKGEWWRLFTTSLIHSDFKHYFSNAYMLLLWGYFTYGHFGPLFYPIGGCLLASVVNCISLWSYKNNIILLGSSGLVYLLGGSWMTFFILIERKHSLPTRFLKAICVGLVIFFPSTFSHEISYRTHFIGFVIGVFYAVFFYLIKRTDILKKEVLEVLEDDEDLESIEDDDDFPNPHSGYYH